jgi:hypothetical protein
MGTPRSCIGPTEGMVSSLICLRRTNLQCSRNSSSNTRDKVQICALDAENRIVPRDGETYQVGRVRCERVSGEFVYELHGRFSVPDEGPVVERALMEADEL